MVGSFKAHDRHLKYVSNDTKPLSSTGPASPISPWSGRSRHGSDVPGPVQPLDSHRVKGEVFYYFDPSFTIYSGLVDLI